MSSPVRQLDTDLHDEVANVATQPTHLVQINTNAGNTYYLSSGHSYIDEFTNTYQEGMVKVSDFGWGGDGSQDGTIAVENPDGFAEDLFYNNSLIEASVFIWIVYRKSDGTFTSRTLLAAGSCTDVVMDGLDYAVMTIATGTVFTQFLPKRYFNKDNGFNWIPAEGTTIIWNGQKYLLEQEVD